MEKYQRIAFLIDAENAPLTKLKTVIADLSKLGKIGYACAYGNWLNDVLKNTEKHLKEISIDKVQQDSYIKGKNATDIALVIGALDLLHTKNFDAFAIFSSDSDYTPLANRIKREGLDVIIIGEDKTHKALRNACTKFIMISVSTKTKKEKNTDSPTEKAHRIIQEVYKNKVDRDNDGWMAISKIGEYLKKNNSDFKIKSTASAQWITFIKKHLKKYEVTYENKTQGLFKCK